jgi:two-component system sensor histidine kinase BaeS
VRKSLLWKLLGINVLIIGFVIVIVWLAINTLAASYFMTLMEKYNISPTSSHQMFVSSIHRYLIWASLGALVLAGIFSYLLMRRVLGPLREMTRITQEITSGDYSGEVPFSTRDEVGQLAASFNHMAEGLRHIEQLRKTMMIDVAHEIRTPLTNIQGYLEGLTDGVVPPTKKTFQLLQEETSRLVHLVEDILSLAKADAARGNLHKIEMELVDLVLQEIEAFQPKFTSKKIHVASQFSKGVGRLRADPEKLSQVISNLLQNALQYTSPGGKIRIYTEPMPGEIKVTFANTGGELDEKDLPLLFERFYRGEKSRSRDLGGAGIGLAIVKELVKAHRGKVGAEIAGDEIHIWFSLPL